MSYITYGKWRKDSKTGISTRNVYRVTKFMGLFEVKKKISREKIMPREFWINVYNFNGNPLDLWIGKAYLTENSAKSDLDPLAVTYMKTIKIEI